MKLLPLFLILFISYSSFSQEEERFQIEGRIINSKGKPVADAYVINFRNHDKYVSRPNGVFNIWALPGDSLVISHISYHRKIVTIHSLLLNPYVELKLDSINIKEVNVSPNQKTENQKAQENLVDIKEQDFPVFTKIDDEGDPVNDMVTEHNKLLRAEAQSISLLRFTPGDIISKFRKKRKVRKNSRQYKSTRKKK